MERMTDERLAEHVAAMTAGQWLVQDDADAEELLDSLLAEREYANARDAAYTTLEAELRDSQTEAEAALENMDTYWEAWKNAEAERDELREALTKVRDHLGPDLLHDDLPMAKARMALACGHAVRALSEHHDNEEGKA